MSEKKQHKNIIITAACTTLVVAVVAVIGAMSIKQEPETIQGQVEVSEYRVSSKVPGRILEIRVKEGDYVKGVLRFDNNGHIERIYGNHEGCITSDRYALEGVQDGLWAFTEEDF